MVATLLAVLILKFTLAMAQTTYPGRCPHYVKPMKDFDIQQYLGRWYEYARYSNTYELHVRCVQDDYTMLSDGVILMNHTKLYEPNIFHHVEGRARVVGPGKLSVRYAKLVASIGPVDYWILGTDYKNYAVAYSCKNFAQVHLKFVWVLMRHPTPTAEQIAATHQILTQQFLALLTLVESDHTVCNEKF